MRAITELVRDGNQVAVVHGGGVQLTRTLKALGKQSEFINGLRITDAETRDVALMVFAGKVNKSLVAALGALGQPAVGLSGGDGLLFRARKKRTAPDLGFVGEIVASDPRWIEAIWQLNGVPVLCSMALGFDGEYYNINADEMAAACAIACRADALVFLTDVPGVKGASGEVERQVRSAPLAGRHVQVIGPLIRIERGRGIGHVKVAAKEFPGRGLKNEVPAALREADGGVKFGSGASEFAEVGVRA
jgi:acetylglutamate kinase